jgi:hypothetical protein
VSFAKNASEAELLLVLRRVISYSGFELKKGQLINVFLNEKLIEKLIQLEVCH